MIYINTNVASLSTHLPQGTVVNPATFTIHKDPRYWEDPGTFLPERWLDDQGHFVPRKEGFIPFGIGEATETSVAA